MHEIRFDEKAIRFLEKLPKAIRKRIYNKIISTKENPYHFFEKLESRQDFKLRVGDYMVIADISDKEIYVTLIGHRKNVYKNNR